MFTGFVTDTSEPIEMAIIRAAYTLAASPTTATIERPSETEPDAVQQHDSIELEPVPYTQFEPLGSPTTGQLDGSLSLRLNRTAEGVPTITIESLILSDASGGLIISAVGIPETQVLFADHSSLIDLVATAQVSYNNVTGTAPMNVRITEDSCDTYRVELNVWSATNIFVLYGTCLCASPTTVDVPKTCICYKFKRWVKAVKTVKGKLRENHNWDWWYKTTGTGTVSWYEFNYWEAEYDEIMYSCDDCVETTAISSKTLTGIFVKDATDEVYNAT